MVCIINYIINLSGYYPIYTRILNIYDIICRGACCLVAILTFTSALPHPNLFTATHAAGCCVLRSSDEIGVQGRWGGKSTRTSTLIASSHVPLLDYDARVVRIGIAGALFSISVSCITPSSPGKRTLDHRNILSPRFLISLSLIDMLWIDSLRSADDLDR